MSAPAELYVKGIRKSLRYFAAWLPTAEYKLGDVGTLENDFFERITTLRKILGISFAVREDKSPTPLEIVSQQGVSITIKMKGEVNDIIPILPIDKAGISLSFSNKGAYVFQASKSYELSIEDIEFLRKQILEAYKERKWRKKWVVITSIVKVPYATYIISNSPNAEIVFEADTNLKQGILDLGSIGVNLTWKRQTGNLIKMVGARNITPFFKLSQIKKRFISRTEFAAPVSESILLSKLDANTPRIPRENTEVENCLSFDEI